MGDLSGLSWSLTMKVGAAWSITRHGNPSGVDKLDLELLREPRIGGGDHAWCHKGGEVSALLPNHHLDSC